MTTVWDPLFDASMYCHICRRLLDDKSDPTTENCGGDCLRCMAEAGDIDCIEAMDKLKVQYNRPAD